MRGPQLLFDIHEELIVDLFAGGGGASVGIEAAAGRRVDVAVNHDPAAVALHKANHPQTRHHIRDVFEVDPLEVTQGRPVGLLWASPDCTYHSKARGAKPIRSPERKRRALAWVVTRWAGQVQPRVIILENVEEFSQWGPLVGPPEALRPCPRRRGRTFRRWVRSLERFGYQVQWRELRASDYGAPTIRKRLFLIARCDGRPIVWPTPTHGPGRRLPYRTAAECIDWSVPMCSIFATRAEAKAWAHAHGQAPPKRPLADATMRRVARGVMRYVVEASEPFLVPLTHGRDEFRGQPLSEPARTITGANRGEQALVAPYLVPRYGERAGQQPRTRDVSQPASTIVPAGNGASLVGAFLAKHYGGHESPGASLRTPASTVTTQDHHHLVTAHMSTYYGGHQGNGRGATLDEPVRTQTTENRHAVVAAHIQRDFGTSTGHAAADPLRTITAGGGGKAALVASFLQAYYQQGTGQETGSPLRTITTRDRLSLVAVTVDGETYILTDIAMRMLQPRELYRAQGFPDSYQIDHTGARKLTKTEQVQMVGNSVCPPVAEAMVRANVPELRTGTRRRRRSPTEALCGAMMEA